MAYQIAFERSAEKELLALPKPVRERILKALAALAPAHRKEVYRG